MSKQTKEEKLAEYKAKLSADDAPEPQAAAPAAAKPAKAKKPAAPKKEALAALDAANDKEIVELTGIPADTALAFVELAEERGLDLNRVETLMQAYGDNYAEVLQLADGFDSIVIEDVNDAAGMASARKARLAIRQVRIDTENKRIQLKADSLREGKAIDGMANIIKDIAEPAEKHLQLQEDYAKVVEQKRLDDLKATRIAELGEYMENVQVFNLAEMPEPQYQEILQGAIAKKKQAEVDAAAEAKKLEDERLAEVARQEERDKVAQENMVAAEKARKEAEVAKKEADDAKAELQKKADDEAAAQAVEDQKQADIDKAAADAAKAPDIDKLDAMAQKVIDLGVEFKGIEFADENAKHVAENTLDLLRKTVAYIKDNAKKV